uniref:Macaca fascicularis brain cDNA clone: QmoA-10722, similar to human F-box and leucine-rich repeat protein 5 (FBXL5),transcript variant 2, mRNA, RefSeq: NM_033535.2 n=1 Tax=Macaca fascicularis TaxID=9541 RepID=I7GJR3_MACFA|nr:unnamed protein product [Macaca fascicularis]
MNTPGLSLFLLRISLLLMWWMLDAEDLADIEDTVEWKHRNVESLCVMETASNFSCSTSGCYSKDIVGLRTSVCWQQHCASPAFAYCGHSFCCTGTALRTMSTLPESSAMCRKASRTRLPRGKDLIYFGSEKSDQETGRVLLFLSLSGMLSDHRPWSQGFDSGRRAALFGAP